ncbi:MAG: hypothetical protein IPJ41_18480 [Phycisphaerales bacterium]|nr:hypothetical protein [Phycisphaerales bacterium]
MGPALTYYVAADHYDDASIEVTDADGKTVTTLTGSGRAGIHRVTWNLQPDPKTHVLDATKAPTFVPAGNYTFTVKIGDDLKSEATIEVLAEQAP